MGEFRMPSLGADMEVGTIVSWRVAPGDVVHRGDIVAVVDTEKSTMEVEVFEDGTVEALLVEPGVEVSVGTPLARIAASPAAGAGASEPPVEPAPEATPTAIPPGAPPGPAGDGAPSPTPVGFVRASPRARRLAAARGLDLAALGASGPGGTVVAGDVERAATGAQPVRPAPPPEAAEEAREPGRDAANRAAGLRHAIGELMARSKREVPHYYLATTVDLGPALDWLVGHNAPRPVEERVLPAALLLKATALALRDVPVLNGFWDEGGFRSSPAVHLGVAVSLRGGGLVAPAIHDADRLDVEALMLGLRDLVRRARAGVLRSSEMADPTITVTNLGDQGVEEVFGVIYPPQVALVGFGRIVERPWAVGGLLGVRPLVRATLSADHRASDGQDGARFLSALARRLDSPEDL